MKIGFIHNKDTTKVFLLPEQLNKIKKDIEINLSHQYLSIVNSKADILDKKIKLWETNEQVCAASDIIFKVEHFTKKEIKNYSNKILICLSNFIYNPEMVSNLLLNNVTSGFWQLAQRKNEYIIFNAIQKQLCNNLWPLIEKISNQVKLKRKNKIVNINGEIELNIVILNYSTLAEQFAIEMLEKNHKVTILDNRGAINNNGSLLKFKKFNILNSNFETIEKEIRWADIFINCAIDPNSRTKKRITTQMAQSMREGSIIINCNADNGPCFEFEKMLKKLVYNSIGKAYYSYMTILDNIDDEKFNNEMSINTCELLNCSIFENENFIVTKNSSIINKKIKKEFGL